MFSLVLAVAAVAASAHAQITGTFPATPLASKTTFTYPSGIPEKVDTDTQLIRGPQSGYNICNSTTENQQSECQTGFLNSLSDFCLWAPPLPNSTVADEEGEMVAWCTQPGRGTRLIPEGAITGVQYMKTQYYAYVVGFINQPDIDLNIADFGGEMDPHGADLRGNPMGGIMFSNIFSGTGSMTQVFEWNSFMGGGAFCFKVCDPTQNNVSTPYCLNTYDRIGCAYNMPNNAQNGTFESCEGDLQDVVGVYTTNGQVTTYTQPAESLGAITTIPYTPRVPASSNCVTHASTDLFTALPAPTNAPSASVSVVVSTGSNGVVTTATRTGAAAGASSTSNGAATLVISGMSILAGAFATLFFA